MFKIKTINKIIDNAITKAIEEDKTNPYLKESRIKAIKEQILTAIKKDLDEPGLTRLDIPEILPKIDKEIKKIGDGIGPKNNYRIIFEEMLKAYNLGKIIDTLLIVEALKKSDLPVVSKKLVKKPAKKGTGKKPVGKKK